MCTIDSPSVCYMIFEQTEQQQKKKKWAALGGGVGWGIHSVCPRGKGMQLAMCGYIHPDMCAVNFTRN